MATSLSPASSELPPASGHQTVTLVVFGLVVCAMSLIVIGDAAGKALTAAGANPFFVAWSRFLIGAVVLFPLFRPRRTEIRQLADWRIILRAALIICAISAILTALRTEPIANVFGGFFIGPVIAYVLSALLLKERTSWRRSLLLALGFVGVLLVIKPGFGMNAGMGFAVLAGCFHGSYLVATRWLAGTFRPGFLVFSQLALGGVVLLPFGVADFPGHLDMTGVVLIAISALGSAAGNYLLIVANRNTPASVIAPLVYSQLIAATFVGFIAFSEWPDYLALAGLVTIVLSGLASLWLAGRGR